MASKLEAPTVQITPLTTHNTPTNNNPHRILYSSASSLINPNHSTSCSLDNDDDGGDIVSYIQTNPNGDTTTTTTKQQHQVVVQRMDGTKIASFDLPISTGDGFQKDDEGPILCWASFQRRNDDTTHHHDDRSDNVHVQHQKLLCVLSNPTTLHLFDVLGDNDVNVNLETNEGGGWSFGPLGHTIPLPFRACALYPLDYYGNNEHSSDNPTSTNCHGLLILRAPSSDLLEPGVPAEVPFSPEGLSIPGTPRRDRDHNGSSNDMEDGLQLPPEPVRLNFQRNDFMNEMEGDDEVVVPSLFSLCHPLDEIRPLTKRSVINHGESDGPNSFFADTEERLIFIEPPRLFARHSCHSSDLAQIYATPICVTYNRALKRHAIWSLTKAVEPVPALPLWKTTGKGGWRSGSATDEIAKNRNVDNAQNEDMSQDTNHDDANEEEEGFPSSFADIFPDFIMTLLHEEEIGDSPDHDMWMETNNEFRRHVFLATDANGTGDLILCIFMQNDDAGPNDEPAILRRFRLNVDVINKRKDAVQIGSVSNFIDLPCTSAQRIQSIPIPLASFSSTQTRCRHISRFHAGDLNSMANDVLIVRQCTGNSTDKKLSLSRSGDIHISDLELPPNVIDNDMELLTACNAIGNRVDLVYSLGGGSSVTARTSFSLIMHTSPITEAALRAIESSLVVSNQFAEHNITVLSGAELSLMIRSECFALSQLIHKDSLDPTVEDHCWYSLTVVLFNLLLGYNDSSGKAAEEGSRSPTSAWEELLQSDFHAAFTQGEGKLLFGDETLKSLSTSPQRVKKDSSDISRHIGILSSAQAGANREQLNAIFDALHMLHEDCRLVSQSRGSAWSRRIGSLLLYVCQQNIPFMVDYEDHYHRLLGKKRCRSNAYELFKYNTHEPTRLSNFAFSPCIMTSLDSLIQPGNNTLEDAYFDMSGYNDLHNSGLNGMCSTSWMVIRLFGILFDNNVNADSRVVSAILKEGIKNSSQLQDELPFSVSYPLLEAILRCRVNPPQVVNEGSPFYELIGRNDLAAISVKASRDSLSSHVRMLDTKSNAEDIDKDGLANLEEFSSMIFPEDNRIREAARLLRSSRTLFLRVPRPVELSDHDYERTKQEKLLLLCRRTIALPLGRGMITLGTHNIQSSEQLFIPNIVLAGRVPPTNNTLALDMTSCPPNFRVWPEFHNGVAAGLQLPMSSKGAREQTITRTWIKFNKPVTNQQQDSGSNNNPTQNVPSYAHGGFLMALGLRGYLSALTTTDLTDYLTQGTITTTVGIFLGMAANKRGSCDPSVSKMLCLHIPSLLPHSFTPMDIASPVQAAAVAGIGLLYQGSAHRLMTEFLINEISQPMKEHNTNDKESFALVCGLALGMVNLQKGTSTLSGLEDLRIEERLQRYIFGSTDEMNSYQKSNLSSLNVDASQAESDKEYKVDNNSINRDITAPGATLALGLMFIQSHNTSIAKLLDLPDTHYLLDFVRPDILALRVISKSLIMWDSIQPSSQWIDAQIPDIVKKSIDFMKRKATEISNFDPENEDDHSISNDIPDFDPQAIRQANAFIIAGSCFSLGLRFAGSACRSAAAAIFERVLYFIELRDNKDMANQVQKPDSPTLVTCLCTAAISLAMVMAGTGDMDSFRLFRALRWRCEDSTLYGTHQIFGAAIGLLFLGGGKCTLGSSPHDIAVLIAAFFPHFPVLSADNQYHLQALRHLYVLAAYDRILEAVDVESSEKVCVPIELTKSVSNQPIMVSTPYLVSNNATFSKLATQSDRYYPIVIDASKWNEVLPSLFVKRKPGHLCYLQDPNALQSLSIQTEGDSFLKAISMFSNDPVLSSFAKNLCTSSRRGQNATFEKFSNDIAHQCMTQGTSEMVPCYLNLFRLIERCGCEGIDVSNVWDARLLWSYTKRKSTIAHESSVIDLLKPEFIDIVCHKFCDLFTANPELKSLAQCDRWWELDVGYATGPLLIWNDIPRKFHVDGMQ